MGDGGALFLGFTMVASADLYELYQQAHG